MFSTKPSGNLNFNQLRLILRGNDNQYRPRCYEDHERDDNPQPEVAAFLYSLVLLWMGHGSGLVLFQQGRIGAEKFDLTGDA